MRVDEHNSFESLLERYRQALAFLERQGFAVADAGRLRGYERRIDGLILDPRPAVEVELAFLAAFDLREIDEIIEIVRYLPNQLDSGTLDLLRKFAGGNEHPDDDAAAPAREAQYELYLGTVLRRAGISARHGAPDLVAQWEGQEFFVEAKRPASPRRLDDRIRSAVHQIRKLARPGIIAISADQLLRPTHGLLIVEGFDDLAPTVEDLLQDFILANGHILRKRLIGEDVAALLWTARIPAQISRTGHVSLGSALKVETLSPGTKEADFAAKALDAYFRAQSKETTF